MDYPCRSFLTDYSKLKQILPHDIALSAQFILCFSNFSNYKMRFTMPGDEGGQNMFYRWVGI